MRSTWKDCELLHFAPSTPCVGARDTKANTCVSAQSAGVFGLGRPGFVTDGLVSSATKNGHSQWEIYNGGQKDKRIARETTDEWVSSPGRGRTGGQDRTGEGTRLVRRAHWLGSGLCPRLDWRSGRELGAQIQQGSSAKRRSRVGKANRGGDHEVRKVPGEPHAPGVGGPLHRVQPLEGNREGFDED